MTMRLNVAKDFTPVPIGRYRKDNKHSGQVFREDVLCPRLRRAIKGGDKLVVDFSEMVGVNPTFLEEAFGGLVRDNAFSAEEVLQALLFEPEGEPYWDYTIQRLKQFVLAAAEHAKDA